jgi:protein-disulfide isomerase
VGEIVQITPVARPQASGTSAGDPNAPVRVDVWEDFQCPGCQFYSQTIEPLIMQNYVETGKVYYTFHVHPFIDDHPSVAVKESDMAANASLCAAEQGFFWEYHDMLFANWNGENEGAFSSKRLIAFAEELSLGMEAFKACTREKRYEAEANASQADGVAKGVQSTPTIFVNDQKVISSRGDGYIAPYQEIAQLIETALGTSTP